MNQTQNQSPETVPQPEPTFFGPPKAPLSGKRPSSVVYDLAEEQQALAAFKDPTSSEAGTNTKVPDGRNWSILRLIRFRD